MKQLKEDLLVFLKCKWYILGLAVTAVLSYGYAVTHYAIGMDDTAVALYYEEGLAPYVGRWSLFIINKFFHISDFAPWMVEFVSVLLLMLSVTLWCVLWKRICEPGVMMASWKYVLVAGVFLSCPLISEVFVFYLHNGICTGYGVTALALIAFVDSFGKKCSRAEVLRKLVLSAVLLTIALGFYESFIIVYVMGAVGCYLLLRCLYGKRGEDNSYHVRLSVWLLGGISVLAGSMVLRMMVLAVLKFVYHLEELSSYNVLYRSLFGSSFTVEGELAMIIKRFWVKYYVNAVAYLPITVLVGAFLVIIVFVFWQGVRKKDLLLPVCGMVLIALPVMMSVVEGLATRYRSAQYVPMISAFAILLILLETEKHRLPAKASGCLYLLIIILIYNQGTEMNSWFYKDNLKYENAKEVMTHIAYDLERDYDISKPIVFRGAYTVPFSITEDAYLRFGSEEYQWICRLTDPIDPHLKEKYFSQNAYVFAESPVVSTLQWGVTAFDGTSQQLIEFWKMHGIDDFHCVTDLKIIEEAEQIRAAEQMPGYPKAGYIKETDEYIIVNLSDAE